MGRIDTASSEKATFLTNNIAYLLESARLSTYHYLMLLRVNDMFSIFKRKTTKTDLSHGRTAPTSQETLSENLSQLTPNITKNNPIEEKESISLSSTQTEKKAGFLDKLWHGMSRTRERFGSGLKNLLTGKHTLDKDTRDELETLLLTADIGLDTTDALLEQLSRVRLKEGEDLLSALAQLLISMLNETQQKPQTFPENTPRVILMVGVNGVGKTTSIAKLAHHFLVDNKKLLLAAGDTFRAAAVEQIKTWGDRHNVPVISQGQGSDAASVLYDALQAAQARKVDVMIGDTAGRLHTQGHLMDELKKIRRVMNKLDINAPHEIWLVIDATTGQNALNQAREFNAAIGLTGIILTKLDGTAKGGIVLSLSQQLGIPIRYIGIGEQAEDLRPFDVEGFVYALLDINRNNN
jgi:fused signal recognition particle receptor